MFLKEATAARRNEERNYGLTDRTFDPSRLTLLRYQLGNLIDGGWWTDADPRQAIGYHDLGGYPYQWSDIETYIKSCLHPIAKSSAGDSYANLDHVPIEHLFMDVQKLSYTYMTGGNSSYSYPGYVAQQVLSIRYYTESRSPWSDTKIVDETRSLSNLWMWYDSHDESYNVDYPGGIAYLGLQQPLSNVKQFTEANSNEYRRRHRYLESVPYGVFTVKNSYDASWQWRSGTHDSDSWESVKYIIGPFPENVFFDTLTATTIVLNNSTAWLAWAANVFNAAGLEMYADDIDGRYQKTDYRSSRKRISYIENPVWVFWVSHMKYCSLDGVNI